MLHRVLGLQDGVLDDQVARGLGRDIHAFEDGHAGTELFNQTYQ